MRRRLGRILSFEGGQRYEQTNEKRAEENAYCYIKEIEKMPADDDWFDATIWYGVYVSIVV